MATASEVVNLFFMLMFFPLKEVQIVKNVSLA